MTTFFRAFRTTPVLTPLQGQAGLLVKSAGAYSHLSLSHSLALIGAYNHDADSDLDLVDVAASHNNHASDPGSVTLSLTQNAGFNWSRSRAISEALALADYAHASLEGYHPPGGGSGDPDLSKFVVTATQSVVVGNVVYLSGNNTVTKADRNDISTAKVFGLVSVGAASPGAATVLTNGYIEQSDWTDIVGAADLVPGATYYLAGSAGRMTTDVSTTPTDVIVTLGLAVTTKKFDIEINEVAVL